MKKYVVILGITIGTSSLLLIGVLALMGHVGMYIADPGFQYSYSVATRDAKVVFVMIGPKAPENYEPILRDDPMIETRRLQNIYRVSGLYRNNGSTSPLWVLEGALPAQYSSKVFLSSDGRYLAKMGWWADEVTSEALAFYKDGKLLKSFSVKDLTTAAWFLPGGRQHYDWNREIKFDDESKTLFVRTEHFDELVFDITTGTIRSTFHPVSTTGFATFGVSIILLLILFRKRMTRRTT